MRARKPATGERATFYYCCIRQNNTKKDSRGSSSNTAIHNLKQELAQHKFQTLGRNTIISLEGGVDNILNTCIIDDVAKIVAHELFTRFLGMQYSLTVIRSSSLNRLTLQALRVTHIKRESAPHILIFSDGSEYAPSY